ncbi:MAG TPA: radical SAM protein [Candidatus Omnitrophota bacterium]|nr:radical SAM protein [Candidatus Omnitrophota bacterium]HRZ15807.1 radical SAM protein [Candidatus Omnitrophota bacterium]
MDKFRIDSHKLLYHVERVAGWLRRGDTYPVYIEISPSGACNHRCRFCALDYLKYKPTLLETAATLRFLKEIAGLGVKSVMFAGEGEPFLHPDCARMIAAAKKSGLDVAATTNAALLTPALLEKALPYLSWLRVSVNAGVARTYSRLHRCRETDFARVLAVIRAASALRKKKKYGCAIGGQILLFRENMNEVGLLAKKLAAAGADYLIVKPYSQHPMSVNRMHSPLQEKVYAQLAVAAQRYSSQTFQVIVRRRTMEDSSVAKSYSRCLGLPFWAYVNSCGDIYGCSAFLGDKRFLYGNIYRQTFKAIWNGDRRRRHLRLMSGEWDIRRCRAVCRLDKINQYLWDLKNPPEHVNFI